ncbi:FAD-dependent oxidoreductase [Streptomyces sp. NPDC008121]|uniref:FAD-dependent oxidoreductase n=1 Tax=Streptomyces sp. NPDC008121 TaxID=3364809 RepID=UPI0036E9317C
MNRPAAGAEGGRTADSAPSTGRDGVAIRSVDVLVVGAGPAGLAAAARLAAAGVGRVEVLERDEEAGGAPRHCDHGGFGAGERGRTVDGPAFARRSLALALRAGAVVRTGVTVTGWAGPLALEVTAPTGLERIAARAVVLATGARERPRSARLVPGTRPAGILTTGELQRSVVLHGVRGPRLGRRAVVIGAEPVAVHAVRTLREAGLDVVARVTDRPPGRRRLTAASGGATPPLLTGATVTEILGRGRLTGVGVAYDDGRRGTVRCDTAVFTGDWIPEHELARTGGVPLDPATRGPAVDGSFRTATTGVFAAGDVLRGVESAATAAAEGRAAAEAVLRRLAGEPWSTGGVPVVAESPLRWVLPHRIAGPLPNRTPDGSDRRAGDGAATRPVLVRAETSLESPVFRVVQDGRLLHRVAVRGAVAPWRSVRLSPAWTRDVDPEGGPVVVGVGG